MLIALKMTEIPNFRVFIVEPVCSTSHVCQKLWVSESYAPLEMIFVFTESWGAPGQRNSLLNNSVRWFRRMTGCHQCAEYESIFLASVSQVSIFRVITV